MKSPIWIQSVNQSLNQRFQIEVVKPDHLMDNHDKIMINFTGPWRLEWFWSGCYLAISQQSSSAKWIRTREMWDFKTESVWSSGQWSVGPSVHGPYQWLARVALVITFTADQFYPTRKEGRAQILQKPAQGHENFQHPWSSRRHSYMKMFKHEDFQNDDQSKKATLLPEDPPPRRSSNIPSPLFCPSLELSSYDISYIT